MPDEPTHSLPTVPDAAAAPSRPDITGSFPGPDAPRAGPADRRFELPAGAYTVEPADLHPRVKVSPGRVELRAGETGKVAVWESPPAPKTTGGEAPPPLPPSSRPPKPSTRTPT